MKLKKGKEKLKLPHFGLIKGVSVQPDECDIMMFPLTHLCLLDLVRMNSDKTKRALGYPCYYSIDGSYLWIFPAPSYDVELRVEFYPPPQII